MAFESDEERALWSALVRAVNNQTKATTELKIVIGELVDMSHSTKTIQRELMQIFRTMANFMAETPDLLNWIMSVSVETKNNLDTMMTIQQQMIKRNQDAKLSIRSPALSIITIADYEFIQMTSKVISAHDNRNEEELLHDIKEWYTRTNVENNGQLSHDMIGVGKNRFKWWLKLMEWLSDVYGISDTVQNILWGTYAVFFPFATENSIAENPALAYLTTMKRQSINTKET